MKRRNIGWIVLVVGIILVGVSFAMSGFNLKNLDSRGPLHAKTEIVKEPITSLLVNEESTNIDIISHEGNELIIEQQVSEMEYYDVKVESQKLEIKKINNLPWHKKFMGLFSMDINLVIKLPKKTYNSIEVNNDNGNIRINGLEVKESLIADNDNGRIDVSQVHGCRELQLKTKNGEISLENVSAGTTSEIKTDNGQINIMNFECETIFVRSNNGKINLDSLATGSLEVKNDNGGITSRSTKVSNSCDLKTNLGDIYLSLIGSAKQYDIQSNTNLGTSNITEMKNPEGIPVRITSDIGSITIEFLDK